MEKTGNSYWKGTHISKFHNSFKNLQFPKLVNNDEHIVLIKTPVVVGEVPECFPPLSDRIDYWDADHIKLPCSEKNVSKDGVNQWELIKQVLSSELLSSQQLEAAIFSYTKPYSDKWSFATLHIFFDEICGEQKRVEFFQSLLPKIVDLALRLPELITGGIPLLKSGRKCSLSLSQVQIASLLANAFLCTFPYRNSYAKGCEYANYPTINFTRLFQAVFRDRKKAVYAKLRFILHYFERVTTTPPTGVVTYSRNFISDSLIPNWSKSTKKLSRLYVSSNGRIEDEGYGLFQLDFAHKLIGGHVLANGCVQEEIRFVICPELILSRLFTESMTDNEAVIITGCERFSKYKGYGKSLEWAGDYVDTTPSDKQGRRYCTVVAIDALLFTRNPKDQYTFVKMNRELNKAYAGFSWGSHEKKELCGIATGNWGCGVYKGDVQLKSLLQLIAAAESNRDLAYFTFGNDKLRDSMHSIHQYLVDNNVSVGKIYNILNNFNAKQLYNTTSVYEYVMSQANKEVVFQEANEEPSSAAIRTDELSHKAKSKRPFSTTKKNVEEGSSGASKKKNRKK